PKSRRDRRTHPDGRRSRSSVRSSALALFAQLPECLLAIDRFHPTALEIVVAAVERLADRGHLFEVPGKGILDDVLAGTSARRGEILQFLGRFRRDVPFHAATVRPRRLTGKCSGRLSQVVDLLEPAGDLVPTGWHWGRQPSLSCPAKAAPP